MTEIREVHPLAANWLTSNNYSWKREAKMPEYGKADFLAQDTHGEMLIVECKPKLDHRTRAYIMQLLGYCHQFGCETKGALAAPKHMISDFAKSLCTEYGICLIELEPKAKFLVENAENPLNGLSFSLLYSDSRPLPIIVAEKCNFRLFVREVEAQNYYSIQDWINGLVASPSVRSTWAEAKRRNEDTFSMLSIQKLAYPATNGKHYQMDFTDDKGLYLIAQNLRDTQSRPILKAIKLFLAEAGVFADLARRNHEMPYEVNQEHNRNTSKLLS